MWRTQPAMINESKEAEDDIDYLFAIDENGTSTLKNLSMMMDNNIFFTITGVLFDIKSSEIIKDNILALKNRLWENGKFKNKRVVFHGRDIRKKQGAFNPKIVDHTILEPEIINILSNSPINIYSASINKLEHFNKYLDPFPVYELGLEFIIERFCFELRRSNKTGIVLLESRGKKEDIEILKKFEKLLSFGNGYNQKENFSCIKGVYFNPKYTNDNQMSYWPLEIADLVSYQIHNYVKTGKNETAAFACVKKKIFGFPNIEGRGLKVFP